MEMYQVYSYPNEVTTVYSRVLNKGTGRFLDNYFLTYSNPSSGFTSSSNSASSAPASSEAFFNA
jgi:hypothetical protein